MHSECFLQIFLSVRRFCSSRSFFFWMVVDLALSRTLPPFSTVVFLYTLLVRILSISPLSRSLSFPAAAAGGILALQKLFQLASSKIRLTTQGDPRILAVFRAVGHSDVDIAIRQRALRRSNFHHQPVWIAHGASRMANLELFFCDSLDTKMSQLLRTAQ